MKTNIEIKFKSEDELLDPSFRMNSVSQAIQFLIDLNPGEYYIKQDTLDLPNDFDPIDMDKAVPNMMRLETEKNILENMINEFVFGGEDADLLKENYILSQESKQQNNKKG